MSQAIGVRIPKETLDIIELFEGKNRSEKIRNYICSSIVQKREIESKIEEYEWKIKILKGRLKSNIFSELYKFSKEEEKGLTEAKKIINTKGIKFLQGQCVLYNKTFNRNITPKEFKLLLDSR